MKKLVAVSAILLLVAVLGAVAIDNYFFAPDETPTDTPTQTNTPESTTAIVPKPSILRVISPTNNTTYTSNSVEITYNINSKVLWSYYRLDGSESTGKYNPEYPGIEQIVTDNGWKYFTGNITINDLFDASHRITIAVQTEESRHSSVPIAYQTIDFTIDTTNNTP